MIVKLVMVSKNGRLTIPTAFRKMFDLSGKGKVTIQGRGNEIIIRPKKSGV